jgi:hypothetical protein
MAAITFASYSEISGPDPIVALGAGTSGGIDAAVHDTIAHGEPPPARGGLLC